MPSFIWIHSTVCPLCTNVTDRQDRTGQERTGQTTDRYHRVNRFTLSALLQQQQQYLNSTVHNTEHNQMLILHTMRWVMVLAIYTY